MCKALQHALSQRALISILPAKRWALSNWPWRGLRNKPAAKTPKHVFLSYRAPDKHHATVWSLPLDVLRTPEISWNRGVLDRISPTNKSHSACNLVVVMQYACMNGKWKVWIPNYTPMFHKHRSQLAEGPIFLAHRHIGYTRRPHTPWLCPPASTSHIMSIPFWSKATTDQLLLSPSSPPVVRT